MAVVFNAKGTSVDSFQIGKAGPTITRSGSNLTVGGATLTAGQFIGPATQLTVADTADATTFPVLVGAATGTQTTLTDGALTYNASTGALSATSFVGALTGNATTATTATGATNIDIDATTSTDTTAFLVLVGAAATGNQLPFIDNVDLSYNANTGNLSATQFGGITEADLVDKTATEDINGAWSFGGANIQDAGSLRFNDNINLIFGTGSDTTIDYTGSELVMNVGSTDFDIKSSTEFLATFTPNGAVTLFHNNAAKLATAADGIDVTGDVGGTTIGGITEANLLDKSASETITASWTFAGTAPPLHFDATGAAADERIHRFLTTASGQFLLQTRTDAGGAGATIFEVNRTGTTVDSFNIAAPLTATSFGGITSANLLDKTAAETISAIWDHTADLRLRTGADLYVFDSANADWGRFRHDGTDFYLEFQTTTDWNISGITAIQAGTVDADFDALTATSFGGITSANLLDKTAAETITASWTWNLGAGSSAIFLKATSAGNINAPSIRWQDSDAVNLAAIRASANSGVAQLVLGTGWLDAKLVLKASGTHDMTGALAIAGALTATSYGGITEANLLDKTATETITGVWEHTNASFGQFEINRISTTGSAAIRYSNDDGLKGFAGFLDSETFALWDISSATFFTVNSSGGVLATSYDGVLSGNLLDKTATETVSGAYTFSAITTVSNATSSTNDTTGALVVTGGIGVAENLNVGGDFIVFSSSNISVKKITTATGTGASGDVWIRIAENQASAGRGACRIWVSHIGGSGAPNSLILDVSASWVAAAPIVSVAAGDPSGSNISDIRVGFDTTDNAKYIDIQLIIATAQTFHVVVESFAYSGTGWVALWETTPNPATPSDVYTIEIDNHSTYGSAFNVVSGTFIRPADGGSFAVYNDLAGGTATTLVAATAGSTLRIADSTDADWLDLSHDGTDFNIVGTNTTDINITSGITSVNLPAIDVTGNITVTGTVDGIDIATDVAANTSKVTNATHTGQVTGSGALTVVVAAITGQTDIGANLVATDEILVSDAGVIRRADISRFNNYFNSVLNFGSGDGTVTSSGSPLNNEVAVFATATDINSDSTFTWDGTTLFATNVTGTNIGGITSANLLDKTATEELTGFWKWTNTVQVTDGHRFRMEGTTDGRYASFRHDNTDLELVGTVTTDWNISGFTTIQAGTVDADFDALTATSFGGITSANLLDKTATEAVSGVWTHSEIVHITQSGGAAKDFFHLRDSTDTTDLYFHYNGTSFELWTEAGGTGNRIMTFGPNVDFGGALTATSFGGITSANLLDKTATETVSGVYTFSNKALFTEVSIGGVDGYTIFLGSTNCQLTMRKTDAATNVKMWNWLNTGTSLTLRTLNDAGTAINSPITMVRNATTVTSINFNATAVSVTGPLTATSFGGITSANLLDKTAVETITGLGWHFDDNGASATPVTFTGGGGGGAIVRFTRDIGVIDRSVFIAMSGGDPAMVWDRLGVTWYAGVNGSNELVLGDGSAVGTADKLIIKTSGVDIPGALTAASFGGITSANLLDKAATETVSGLYTFTNTKTVINTLFMNERSFSASDVAGDGQFWVKTVTPNEPFFTNDAGEDQLIDPSRSEINTQNGIYVLLMSDRGKTIHKTSGGAGETITIPANSSVAYPLGTLIAFQNDGGGDLTIAINTDTLTGTDGSTGSKTLGDNHTAVVQKMTATTWKYAASDL